jgi:N-acetylneuraminic acid mutarotase
MAETEKRKNRWTGTPSNTASVVRRVALVICSTAAPLLADEPRSPSPQVRTYPMVTITWSRGPDLPQGFQDSDGGINGSDLVTVGGFCSGGLEEDNRQKPGRYPRGFLKQAWSIDIGSKTPRWSRLPDFPGTPRQGLSAALVKDALYFWGGFSYTEPYTYDDGWRLSKQGESWKWEPLPRLSWRLTTVAMSVSGTKIYAFGGADYNSLAFFTEADRAGRTKRLGARLLVHDTEDAGTGWKELPPCPGTPRWVHAMALVEDKLYVIGGASGNTVRDGVNYGYCTIVDNWSFDTRTEQWARLRDLPVSSGNFPRGTNLVFKQRYIIFPGGHQYGYVLNPDGTVREQYGVASQANPASGLHNDVFVYDTRTDLFGTANALPIDNNLPMTVVHGDQIYLLGGETGDGLVDGTYYGHHPDLFLKGTMEISRQTETETR